jgi:hypothetical protein
MQLLIHINASYPNEPEASSQIGGNLYFGNNVNEAHVNNGAIHNNINMSDMVILYQQQQNLNWEP